MKLCKYAFCVAWQKDIQELNAACVAGGGVARFSNDDGYSLGPLDIVFPVAERFAIAIRERCKLMLERTKTEVFSWSGELPYNTLMGIKRAGRIVDGVFELGFMCYSVPIGTNIFERDVLKEKVEEVTKGADISCKVLGQDSQAL